MKRGVAAVLVGLTLTACQNSPSPITEAGRVWLPAGGSATAPLEASRPFLQFAPSIDASELAGVSQGRELFVATWLRAPASQTLLDGLGPQFIANACTSCHQSSGRVEPLRSDGTTTPAILFRLGNAQSDRHPVYGEQLQTAATVGEPEGTVSWQREDDGRIRYLVSGADLGEYRASPRLSPELLGMGLLDLVPEAAILEWADETDRNGDGISGRPHWIAEAGERRLGRFGWKAVQSTLRTQAADAFHQDMGLTSFVHPQENCTDAQTVCSEVPNGGLPELSDATLDAVNDFLTALAVPERRTGDLLTFNRGADLFELVGCAACHRQTLRTGVSTRFPSLSNQTFYPYTDLLLHDMSAALDDGAKEKDARSSEWRTPPLWGVGLVEAGGGRFLHDGRASSIREAIGWHGGEASQAKDRFDALSDTDRTALLAFLRGL